MLRTGLRVVFGSFDMLRTGSGDFQQDVAQHLAVVGDVEDMLLNSEMDRVGVEGFGCLWGVLRRTGGRAQGPVQRLVDPGDQPGGLGFGRGLYVVGVGFGGRVGVWACAGSYLLGGLAECSIVEDVGGGDAVVSGGHFVGVLGDVAQNLDKLEAVVGHIEDGLGEFEGRGLMGSVGLRWS